MKYAMDDQSTHSNESKHDSNRKKAGWFKSVFRWIDAYVMGYDVFVSYAWSDGRTYAANLVAALKKRKYRCFLDSSEYKVGTDLNRDAKRAVKLSSAAAIIITPNALQSEHVRKEIFLFDDLEKPLVPIDINETMYMEVKTEGAAVRWDLSTTILNVAGNSNAKDKAEIENILTRISRDSKIQIAESSPTIPSDSTIDSLCQRFSFARNTTRRLRVFAGVTLLLLGLTAVAYQQRATAINARIESDNNFANGLFRAFDDSDSLDRREINALWELPYLTPETRSLFLKRCTFDDESLFRFHAHSAPIVKGLVGLNKELFELEVQPLLSKGALNRLRKTNDTLLVARGADYLARFGLKADAVAALSIVQVRIQSETNETKKRALLKVFAELVQPESKELQAVFESRLNRLREETHSSAEDDSTDEVLATLIPKLSLMQCDALAEAFEYPTDRKTENPYVWSLLARELNEDLEGTLVNHLLDNCFFGQLDYLDLENIFPRHISAADTSKIDKIASLILESDDWSKDALKLQVVAPHVSKDIAFDIADEVQKFISDEKNSVGYPQRLLRLLLRLNVDEKSLSQFGHAIHGRLVKSNEWSDTKELIMALPSRVLSDVANSEQLLEELCKKIPSDIPLSEQVIYKMELKHAYGQDDLEQDLSELIGAIEHHLGHPPGRLEFLARSGPPIPNELITSSVERNLASDTYGPDWMHIRELARYLRGFIDSASNEQQELICDWIIEILKKHLDFDGMEAVYTLAELSLVAEHISSQNQSQQMAALLVEILTAEVDEKLLEAVLAHKKVFQTSQLLEILKFPTCPEQDFDNSQLVKTIVQRISVERGSAPQTSFDSVWQLHNWLTANSTGADNVIENIDAPVAPDTLIYQLGTK